MPNHPSHSSRGREDAVARLSRRSFLHELSLSLGAPIVFEAALIGQVEPRALLAEVESSLPAGKGRLHLLSDRPFNAETPVTLLDDAITPNDLHFVRNNGLIPERAKRQDPTGWTLTIDGEVRRPLTLTLDQLRNEFRHHEAALVIECAGNGRAGFRPRARGNQWTIGAVGCARYKGVRLPDVLRRAGLKASAVYLGYYGEDLHLSRDPRRPPISRGVPIAKAMERHTLLAWEMNGVPLPPAHGFPLRMLCPGWPGSTGGKWLKRIWVRDRVHDGPKMTGMSYRVPAHPVAPGTAVAGDEMVIIEAMPVKSIITHPGTGEQRKLGRPLKVGGHAWSGLENVKAVHVSYDFGATWKTANLSRAENPYAWQHWEIELRLPSKGYYEIWARATDVANRMQPMVVPGWNPKGYLNNAMHRIAIRVV